MLKILLLIWNPGPPNEFLLLLSFVNFMSLPGLVGDCSKSTPKYEWRNNEIYRKTFT